MQRTGLGSSSLRTTTMSIPQVITSSIDANTIGQKDNVLVRTAISLEYTLLRNINHCPLGMYVLPSPTHFFVWDAVFFIHQGYYADSVFKFRITFPQTFPEQPPSVDFVTEVFHPLVSHTGAFNLGYHFKHWRADEHHIVHVLHWIKTSFKKNTLDRIQESDCYNKEAFRLYRESTSSFANLAAQSAQLSSSDSVLFDTDDRHPKPKSRGTHGPGGNSGMGMGTNGSGSGTGGGSMSRVGSGSSGVGSMGGSGSGLGQMGLSFDRLENDELRTEREKLGLKEWIV